MVVVLSQPILRQRAGMLCCAPWSQWLVMALLDALWARCCPS